MRKWMTAAVALVALAMLPHEATAQSAQAAEVPGGGACSYCEMCPSIIYHWHHEAQIGDTVLEHGGCEIGGCGTRTPCGAAALPEDADRNNRLNDVLNTLDGDERIVALVDEFSDQIVLASGALEVEGMLCQEGTLIGRLQLSESQVAYVTGGSTYLAAAF